MIWWTQIKLFFLIKSLNHNNNVRNWFDCKIALINFVLFCWSTLYFRVHVCVTQDWVLVGGGGGGGVCFWGLQEKPFYAYRKKVLFARREGGGGRRQKVVFLSLPPPSLPPLDLYTDKLNVRTLQCTRSTRTQEIKWGLGEWVSYTVVMGWG